MKASGLWASCLLGLAAFSLAACASGPTPQELNRPLQRAFEDPVESLREQADAGDRHALYALSFLKIYGLRGVAHDPVGAEALRAKAGQPVTRTVAVYVPSPTKGGGGSVMNMPMTQPGVSDSEARRLDLCGGTLMLAQPALGGQLCGSPNAYSDLLAAASTVRGEMRRSLLHRVEYQAPLSISTV